jgi:ketosteroid isomerase-like protein
MHTHEKLIRDFFKAFQRNDYRTMQESYHPEASYSDPVFGNLDAAQAKAMWKMLVTSAKDLHITYGDVKANDQEGSCRWDAQYTFSGTGRKVHNQIKSSFVFKDGKIFRHDDHFNFWRWSSMALGGPGLVMGWSPYLLHAVQKRVRGRLEKFMKT